MRDTTLSVLVYVCELPAAAAALLRPHLQAQHPHSGHTKPIPCRGLSGRSTHDNNFVTIRPDRITRPPLCVGETGKQETKKLGLSKTPAVSPMVVEAGPVPRQHTAHEGSVRTGPSHEQPLPLLSFLRSHGSQRT